MEWGGGVKNLQNLIYVVCVWPQGEGHSDKKILWRSEVYNDFSCLEILVTFFYKKKLRILYSIRNYTKNPFLIQDFS